MRKLKLALALALSLTALTPAAALQFDDTPDTAWYAPYVNQVYTRGLMTGTGIGTFSPNTSVSKAEVMTVLYQMSGEHYTTAGKNWYDRYMQWAVSVGILDTDEHPNRLVTRSELCSYLRKFEKYRGSDVSTEYDISSFADSSYITGVYQEDMAWAVERGYVCGTDTKELLPYDPLTRAQFATILCVFGRPEYVVDTPGLRIKVDGPTTLPDGTLVLNVTVENHSGQDLNVYPESCAVNGLSTEAICYMTVPHQATVESYMLLTATRPVRTLEMSFSAVVKGTYATYYTSDLKEVI